MSDLNILIYVIGFVINWVQVYKIMMEQLASDYTNEVEDVSAATIFGFLFSFVWFITLPLIIIVNVILKSRR